ncbi:ATP-binding protein [Streptomyces sp. NPDC005708]|uniref:ATP-binding protein n=1 Tax=Streptomyces sp. NPDC005708 TaxID=3154564 RepID=UPI0033C65CA6
MHADADLTGLQAPQRAARKLVREALVGVDNDGWVDDIVLVADELVGNAQQYAAAQGPIEITVDRYLWGIAVQVRDSHLPASAIPLRPKQPGQESLRGRGLFLVDALASAWGVQLVGSRKIVTAIFIHRRPKDGNEHPPSPPCRA